MKIPLELADILAQLDEAKGETRDAIKRIKELERENADLKKQLKYTKNKWRKKGIEEALEAVGMAWANALIYHIPLNDYTWLQFKTAALTHLKRR